MKYKMQNHNKKTTSQLKKQWKKIAIILSTFVVISTLYGLSMPADTMSTLHCTQEEHIHTPECYSQQIEQICGQEEYEGHTHDETCFDEEGNLVCGLEETPGHTHTAECYQTQEILTCAQEEHEHNAQCYTVTNEEETVAAPVEAPQTYPAQTFEEEKDTIKVTAIAEEGALPEGTTMRIDLVEDQAILDSAKEKVGNTSAQAVAVDITFLNAEGYEIEPEKEVRVTIKTDAIAQTDDVTVVHMDENQEPEIVEQKNVEELPEEERPVEDEVIFESDAFSTYVLVYTVDFSYGDYAYSIQGETSIYLSDLLNILQVYKENGEPLTIYDVASVSFTNDTLVSVYPEGDNWVGQSLQPFTTEEKLTLYLVDGKNIDILVKDAQTTTTLENNVQKITISGATKTENGYQVSEGDSYEISVLFKENDNYEFNLNEDLTYQLPYGVTVKEKQSGEGTLKNEGGTVVYKYEIDTNGVVTIKWPEDKSSDAWIALTQSQYTDLSVTLRASFNTESDQIDFKAATDGKVTIDKSHDLDVEKTGNYNAATNKVDYTVKITSKGHNTNVNVEDVIKGSALTYDASTFSASPSNGQYAENGKGFTYHLDEMHNNETVTLTYSADVNLDGMTRNADGTYGTVTQTGNSVKVEGDGVPSKEKEVDGSGFGNKISYSTIDKSAGDAADTDESTTKRLTWTIHANDNANVSMAGKTITDTIDAGSRDIMKYSGDGITVIARDKEGNPIGEPRKLTWTELEVNPENATGWTYHVPETDSKYSYEIVYTTDVQAHQTDSTNVKNKVENEFGDSKEGSKEIGPTAGKTGIKKDVSKIDIENNEIEWKMVLDIPTVGYDDFYVIEKYPVTYINNADHYDAYKVDSIKVEGLVGSETYTATEAPDAKSLRIDFFKDGNETRGVCATPETRKITITLTTIMNEDLVQRASETGEWVNLQNNAELNAGGKPYTANAQARFQYEKGTLVKDNENNVGLTVNYVNGDAFPAIRYNVQVTGITDNSFDENGNLILTDEFDSTYLAWLPVTNQYGGVETTYNGFVYGTDKDSSYRYNNPSEEIVINRVADGKLEIRLNRDSIPKTKAGAYYYRYTIPYYLTVKDNEALETLNRLAGSNYGGIYQFTNKVSNPKFGTTENKYNYQTDIVKKEKSEAVRDETSGNFIVNYTLTINPQALKLGESNSLKLVDKSEHLSIDLESIKATPSLGVSWNLKEMDELEFTVPNETAVTITYQAKVVGTGNVEYSNTAEFYGQDKTVKGTCDISSDSSGHSYKYSIDILKHEEGDTMATLEGVGFQLWMLSERTGSDMRPASDDPRWVLINDADDSFVTDSEGRISITAKNLLEHDHQNHHEGNGLYHSRWYKVVETVAPTVNGVEYELDTAAHLFWIDPDGNADYRNSVYANDDTIVISNKPKDNTQLGFTVKKLWDGVDSDTIPESITIHLMQKDSIYDSNESAVEVRSITLKKSEFNDTMEWTGEFVNLEKGKAYFITEDLPDGFTAVYEDTNSIGYTRNGTINLKNIPTPENPKPTGKSTEVRVEKKWLDAEGTEIEPSASAKIELVRYRKEADGTVIHFLRDTNGNGNYEKKFDDVLVSSDTALEFGVDTNNIYSPINVFKDAYPTGSFWSSPNAQYIDSSTENTATYNVKVGSEKDIYVVIHQQEESFRSVTVKGGQAVADTSDSLDGYTLDPDFYAEKLTLAKDNNWQGVFTDLAVLEPGNDSKFYSYKYLVKEVEASNGFKFVSYTYDTNVLKDQNAGIGTAGSTDKTIVVTNQQQNTTTDFKFKKIWKDVNDSKLTWNDGQNISVTLHGTKGSESKDWTYTISKTNGEFQIDKSEANAPDMMVGSESDSFMITGLVDQDQNGKWTYTLTEQKVDGYVTQYYTAYPNGSRKEADAFITSGEVIVNKQEAYFELPKTGGSGTTAYVCAGFGMILMSILLLYRKKQAV